MNASPARVLAKGSRRRTVVFAVAAGAAFWVLDAAVEVVRGGTRTLADELWRPTAIDVWMRVLVTALLVLMYRSLVTKRRLHVLSSALATAPDGVQIANLDGTVAWSNEAVRDIYGYSPDELAGRHVNEMNADPTFASRVILPALAREGRWEGELDVKHRSGRIFPIWLTTSVIQDRRQRPLAAIGVIRDISERKRIEQDLREYARQLEEATAMKDLFADILRHDLLGPASTVQLSLDSVLRRDTNPETTRRILESARRSCKKLIDLTEGAAKYAKLSTAQQLDFAKMDLCTVIGDLVAESDVLRRERQARVVFEPPGDCAVRANPMVADVFENLLSNALKYGPIGGTIRIDVSDAGDRWKVSVADEGEGIPDEDKQKLFTRFERLRKEGVKGTGLGLAIAKRIVDLHGGTIWVEDAAGGGAVFCVSLPKAPGDAAAPSPR